MSESLDLPHDKPEKGALETSNSAGPNSHQYRPSAGNVELRGNRGGSVPSALKKGKAQGKKKAEAIYTEIRRNSLVVPEVKPFDVGDLLALNLVLGSMLALEVNVFTEALAG